MKKLVLALTFCFCLGCVNVAYADFWGRLAHAIDVNAKTLEKDTRNFVKRNHKEIKILLTAEKVRENAKDFKDLRDSLPTPTDEKKGKGL